MSEEVMDDVLANVHQVKRQVGRNLRMYRAYHRLDQSELAAMAGLDRHTVVEYESGDGNPRLRTLSRIAYALNMDVKHLFARVELPPLRGGDPHQEEGTGDG